VGTIRARGRIASLLEVGTGFHQEMTGRENIFMNGAILGMTKQEIAAKLDEIVDFSGCERYLDTPVKRYSSGMMVRLGFAVAAHLDPEILVVDEVLAVGDAEFQKKAIGKMQDVSKGEGRTVLFVSHNMASVRQLCNTGVLLENGIVKYKGDISSTINNYLLQTDDTIDDYIDAIKYQSNQILIEKFLCNGKSNGDIEISSLNNSIEFYFKGYAKDTLKIALEVRLYDMNEVLLGVFSPSHLTGNTQMFNGEFELNYLMHLPSNITKGDFYLEIALTHPNVEYWLTFNKKITLHSQGIVGITGQNFDYAGTGFLMLS
jgi:lipopolysaccharide transport system ATP-binding protein